VIDSPPPATPARPPVIERPAAHQVSYGLVEGRAAPGTRRVLVRVDGRVVRELRLRGGTTFSLDVPLPPRETRVRVETVDAKGRRAGRTVGHVFGLPQAARPRLRPLRLDPALQRDVVRLVRDYPGTAAVYVENLATGAGAAWNARARFPAASTLKLAIAVTVLTRLDGPPGVGTPVDRLLRAMLIPSDNEAANRLLVMLGGSTSGGGALVNATMRSLGLERTEMYGGYILGTSLEPPTREVAARGVPLRVDAEPSWGVGKATTALDLARLLRAVWLRSGGLGPLDARSGVSPAEARYVLYVLAHGIDRRKLGRRLSGKGVVLMHKAGWVDAARHDAGLVAWRGGIYVAAVMTYRPNGAGARADVLAGTVADAALRRFRG
jgi:beta-lactamase class A